MKTALVIMAAGLGSRFEGGIKQLAAIGTNGEIIMDYSIHDALAAGFEKIIIVIRKEIENDFKEVIGTRIEKVCREKNAELKYAFQSLEAIPSEMPEGRVKPWGTGQAVLSAKNELDCPFAVINADDYYGKASFEKIHDYLCNSVSETNYCMAGFVLENTLSENGGVTRGICLADENNNLLRISETRNIVKNGNSVSSNSIELNPKAVASMNMWGFDISFVELLEKGFVDFFVNEVPENPLKSEYLLPMFVEKLLRQNKVSVKVIPTEEKWFGVTYKEDVPSIRESFAKLIKDGTYNSELYSDL